jgi:hypothetical protein
MKLRDDVNTYNSLYHLSLRWARADVNNFPYADFIQSFNVAVNKITAIVLRHDKGWKSMDRNDTGQLLDTTLTLTSGVSAYSLSLPWLKIARVRIKLTDGTTWKTLQFKDRIQLTDAELASNNVAYYYLLGGTLYLAGVPNWTMANGIEVEYQKGPVHFTPTDLDEEVGFSPLFEELGALMPALDYLEINGPDEQARKVEKKIGIEPRRGIEGSGLLNDLAVSYQERNDVNQTISLPTSGRALGLTDGYSGNYPMY